MTRVPHCKGSYRKRKDKHTVQVIVSLGWDEQTQKYVNYYEEVANEPEAILALKEINEYFYFEGDKDCQKIANYRNRKLKQREMKKQKTALTFNDVAQEFIDLREAQKNHKPRTIKTYREVAARVKPYIGNLRIIDITPRDIDQMYARMRSDGRDNLSGKPYSGTTLERTHNFIKLVFDKALSYGYVKENPLLRVERPKRDTKEKKTMSLKDAQELYLYIINDDLEAHNIGLLIGLLTGTRLSEMLALTWDCYDGDALNIHKSLEKDSQTIGTTKTGENRSVTCPEALKQVLDKWKTIQKTYYKKIGLKWTKQAPIVNSSVGGYILQSGFRRWLVQKMPELPVAEPFTFHQLRHTYITFLFRDCGVDEKTTRSLSGHKTAKAFSGYTHTNEEWKHIATERLSQIIAPSVQAQKCQTCVFWSVSPIDKTRGSCWRSSTPTEQLAQGYCDEYKSSM